MADIEVDLRPEAIARARAESVGLSWESQSDWWRRSKVEQHTRDMEAADKVDPLRQCKHAGKRTALVHKSQFESVLAERDEARAELAALKKKLGELSQS